MLFVPLLILSVLAACAAASSDALGLDVIGSDVEEAFIAVPYGGPVDVEIIGSTASNIRIGYPEKKVKKDGCCDDCVCCGCDACGNPKCYTTPWDDFRRPLCYPWSSYIPTRYNRPFNKACGYDAEPFVLTIGRMTAGS